MKLLPHCNMIFGVAWISVSGLWPYICDTMQRFGARAVSYVCWNENTNIDCLTENTTNKYTENEAGQVTKVVSSA